MIGLERLHVHPDGVGCGVFFERAGFGHLEIGFSDCRRDAEQRSDGDEISDRMDEAKLDVGIDVFESLRLRFVLHQTAAEEDEGEVVTKSSHDLAEKTAKIAQVVLKEIYIIDFVKGKKDFKNSTATPGP